MPFYYFILGTLGVWRVTHLLHSEDGPGKILSGLREMARDAGVGTLFDCFYCLSIWVAVPFAFALGEGWHAKFLMWPALSAGAILAERLTATTRQSATETVTYFEEPEEAYVLRQKQ